MSDRALVALFALVKLALHIATSSGYGYFRDEFYYLACGDHLAWGYVDHPPLSSPCCGWRGALFGDSLARIRLPPALAGRRTVLLTGLMARELGGGRCAQALAMPGRWWRPSTWSLDGFYLDERVRRPGLGWRGSLVALVQAGDRGVARARRRAGPGAAQQDQRPVAGRRPVRRPPGHARAAPSCGRALAGRAIALALFAPHLVWQARTAGRRSSSWTTRAVAEDGPSPGASSLSARSMMHAAHGAGLARGARVALRGRERRPHQRSAGPISSSSRCSSSPRRSPTTCARSTPCCSRPAGSGGGTRPGAAPGRVAEAGLRGVPAPGWRRHRALALPVAEGGDLPPLRARPRRGAFHRGAQGARRSGTVLRGHARLGCDRGDGRERPPQAVAGRRGGRAASSRRTTAWPAPSTCWAAVSACLRRSAGTTTTGSGVRAAGTRRRAHRGRQHRAATSGLFERVQRAATTSCGHCMPYENNRPVWIARGLRLPVAELWPRVKHYD